MLPWKQASTLSRNDGILEQQRPSGGTKSHRNRMSMMIGSRTGSWNQSGFSPRNLWWWLIDHSVLLIGHVW